MKLATRTFQKNRGIGVDQYYVTSPFGWRRDPINGVYKGHSGCDYGTHSNKWPQYALEDGIVENVYKDIYGAKCLRIRYPRLGIRLTYAHLDRVCVRKNQSVNSSTIIGYTGTTGHSTGIHLHLGVQKIGSSSWIDPETIDYNEETTTAPIQPSNEKYPCNAIVKKGSPLYNEYGYKYPNNAYQDRNVVVLGEANGKFKISCKNFNPNIVYCDKSSIKGYSDTTRKYPFDAIVVKGSNLYNRNGAKYKYGAQSDRNVQVRGEVNGRYEIYGSTFRPNIVYCDKSSIK